MDNNLECMIGNHKYQKHGDWYTCSHCGISSNFEPTKGAVAREVNSLREERKMIRHILFSYNDNDGPKMRSYVDDTAAIRDFMEETFGDQEGFDEWLALLRQDKHVEHTRLRRNDQMVLDEGEITVIALHTLEIY